MTMVVVFIGVVMKMIMTMMVKYVSDVRYYNKGFTCIVSFN